MLKFNYCSTCTHRNVCLCTYIHKRITHSSQGTCDCLQPHSQFFGEAQVIFSEVARAVQHILCLCEQQARQFTEKPRVLRHLLAHVIHHQALLIQLPPVALGSLPTSLAQGHSCLLVGHWPPPSASAASLTAPLWSLWLSHCKASWFPEYVRLLPVSCIPLLGAEYFSNQTGLFLLIPLDSA